MQNKFLGYKFEKLAKDFLLEKGYKILKTNFTIRGGEIDLITFKDGVVSFVEVKGVSQEMDFQDYITKSKIKALKKTAQHWIYQNDTEDIKEYKFDLILIKNNKVIDFIENFIN